MKKIVRKPDGTEVVFEGTAEEIAELERRLGYEGPGPKDEDKKGKKKVLLTEEQVTEILEGIRELKGRPDGAPYWHQPVAPFVWPDLVREPDFSPPFRVTWNGNDVIAPIETFAWNGENTLTVKGA